MSRPARFFVSAFLSILGYLCFFLSINGLLQYRAVQFSAWLQWFYWASMIAMFMMLTLTNYVVIGQMFPQEEDPYLPEQEMNIIRVGAIMLLIGLGLVIIGYLNWWAAADHFTYEVCVFSARTDCERTVAATIAAWTRYIGFGTIVLSLPTLLVGLLVNGVEGWGN